MRLLFPLRLKNHFVHLGKIFCESIYRSLWYLLTLRKGATGYDADD